MTENKKCCSAVTTTKPQLYKNFFRMYYRENWRTARIICTVVSVPFIILTVKLYTMQAGIMWCVAAAWAAAVLNVYPRQAYRRQYRKIKDERVTTRFDFYEDYVTEKTSGALEKYFYKDMYKVIETGQYFYLFHTNRDVSVVEKSGITGDKEKLGKLLEAKTRLEKR